MSRPPDTRSVLGSLKARPSVRGALAPEGKSRSAPSAGRERPRQGTGGATGTAIASLRNLDRWGIDGPTLHPSHGDAPRTARAHGSRQAGRERASFIRAGRRIDWVDYYYGWYCWSRYRHFVSLEPGIVLGPFEAPLLLWGWILYPSPWPLAPFPGDGVFLSGGWNPYYFGTFPTLVPTSYPAGISGDDWWYDEGWLPYEPIFDEPGPVDGSTPVLEVSASTDPAGIEVSTLDLAELYLRLGDLHFKEGDYERAVVFFERAVELEPELPVARFALSDALFAIGEYSYAAFMIRRGIELDPDWVRLDLDRRDFYGDPEDFDAQLEALAAHVRRNPYDESAWLVLGYNQYFTSAIPLALLSFETVIELRSGDGTADIFLRAIDERRHAAPGGSETAALQIRNRTIGEAGSA